MTTDTKAGEVKLGETGGCGSKVLNLRNQLCFSVYSTSIAINRLYKPILDPLGLTYPQYLVLAALWEEDVQSIGAIADRLALESSTITPLVKRLEAGGFVTRQRCTVDERQVHVRLTPQGCTVREKTFCLKDAMLEKTCMTEQDIIRLNEDVQRLLRGLTKPADAA
jgi:MarR family transcriptional regulator, organic hydroperoxide resistance regulator